MKSPAFFPTSRLCFSLFVLLLAAGCAGHNGPNFPWSVPEDTKLEHVTMVNFDERVLKCEKPVLVDFYAEWCNPCKQLTPRVEEFAAEHPEYRVVKVNFDQNRELAKRYGVAQLPTLIAFRGGTATGQPSVGLVPKQQLTVLMASSTETKVADTKAADSNSGAGMPVSANSGVDAPNRHGPPALGLR